MWSNVSKFWKIALSTMGAVTAVLGFLTFDQLSNPPVFSPNASFVTDANGTLLLEVELAAKGEFALKDAQISYVLMDASGARIDMTDTAPGERDYFVPVDMLIAANTSKFAAISDADLVSASVVEAASIYMCATFKGRILGTYHQQTYLLQSTGDAFFQVSQDAGFGVFAAPRCSPLDGADMDFPFPGKPSDF